MLRKRLTQILVAVALVAAGTFAFQSCSSVPLSGRNRVNIVSDNTVLASSFQQYREFISKAPLSKNKALTRRVVNIGTRIAQATDRYLRSVGLESDAKQYRWEFNLVASDQANAFCMPGGKIVVYEGITRYAATDDELATVISHEVAHAVAKHANERMSNAILTNMGGNVLGIALGQQSAIVRQVAGQVYGIGSQVLVQLPYSRKHEFEADQIGLYLMALAGYNPQSAVSFWQKMGGAHANRNDFLSTHPNDARRVEAIRNELPKVEAFMRPNATAVAPKPVNTQQKKVRIVDNEKRKVPLKTHY